MAPFMDPSAPTRFLRSLLSCSLALSLGTARADLVRVPNTTLNLPAQLPAATGYSTANALGTLTFSAPICTAYPSGETNRLYVVQRGGLIRVVNNLGTTPAAASFMDLATYLSAQGTPLSQNGENGLLAMAFHPDYNQNGFFFLYYSITSGGQLYQRLARFKATGTAGNYNAATSADPATQAPLLTMRDEASNHNGGDLAFGADGYLYISLGDEGGANDQFNNARLINKDFWGQMLRLDVDNAPVNLAPNPHSAVHAGAYRIPRDNPFIGYTSWHGGTISASSVRTEIFASGLRNPFRFSIDPATGRIFLGDVGQGNYEEINIVAKGGDYGWSWREGLHAFTSGPAPATAPASYAAFRKDPIYEFDHSNDGSGNDAVIYGNAVMGGIVYRGNQLPELHGKYLFGDNGTGIIAALTENTSTGVWSGQRLTSVGSIADFGTDPRNGEPLLCSLSGTIRRLTRSGTSGTPPPATLSATGAFSNLATLTPNAGIVPYQPNVDFWSDYAHKSRWFSIKNTSDTMTWTASGNWTFPTGMVWIKHFDFDTTRGDPGTRRRLETRFLVKTATGVYGLSYKWRADQSDADLVSEEGLSEVVPSSSPAQTWRFPSRAECVTCHSAVAGHALSFNNPQMNREHVYGGASQNQITALSDAGYFSSPATGVGSLPAFARADDSAQTLEWRVRSYLSVNCVQCHQPGGAAQGNWDARHTTPVNSANLIYGALVNDAGDADSCFVVPQDTGHSMLLRRLQGNSVPRMPPLATSQRDLAAEQLVTDWINSLTPRQSGVLAIEAPPGGSIPVNETAGKVQIVVRRTNGSEGEVRFTVATVNGTAFAGSDFQPPTSSVQVIPNGETDHIVDIPILNPPGTNELNENFIVQISNPTGGATLGPTTSVTVTIVDSVDDVAPPAPTITRPAAGVAEGVNTLGSFEAKGTATDGKGVGRVEVTLNDVVVGNAALDVPGASSTPWKLQVTPVTGTNTIKVQTFDTQELPSPPVTRSFLTTRPLGVEFDASLGGVTAGFTPSPSYREVGKSLSITATPKASPPALFTGWTLAGVDVAQGNATFSAQRLGMASSSLEKQALTFIFREGLILQAGFTANPYTSAVIGTYNGLIAASPTLPDRANGDDGSVPSLSTEGYFSATVMSTGAFSAKLTIDGFVLNLAGSFDQQGRARFGTTRSLTQVVARPNKPSLIVKLDIGGPALSVAPAGKITGQVTAMQFPQGAGPASVSTVVADRAHFTGLTDVLTVPDDYLTVTGSAASPTGRTDGVFTVRLPSVPLASQPDRIATVLTERDYPQSSGVGTLRVTKAGLVTLTATLADGTPVAASSTLSSDLRAALFAQLYSLKGFLSAPIQLDHAQTDSDLKAQSGKAVLWSRPFIGTSHYYPFGWAETLELDLLGARYVAASNQGVLKAPNGAPLQDADADGNVTLTFSLGQLSAELVKSANLSKADVVTKVPSNDLTFTMTVNRATGAITGTFDHTDDTKPSYNAIIFQKGPNAGAHGYFLTKQPTPIDFTGESGRVLIIGQP
ncbi:hypothetical protein AYO49_03655 [Verrucomicrobiaceae bacterium SCGC AG-212-N21]|nr:hypothetical protein AYO49_03655 [Verrucomicrobiaceae bacterium SCGC AG-212-N21]